MLLQDIRHVTNQLIIDMQEILIEIMLSFFVSSMAFSVKRGGSEPLHDHLLSMGFKNHINERAKLSRKITIREKISNISTSRLRLLLKHLTEDHRKKDNEEFLKKDRQESHKSRRKSLNEIKFWRRNLGDDKIIKASRFNRFRQFHGSR